MPQGTPISAAMAIANSVRKSVGSARSQQRLRDRPLQEDRLAEIAVRELAQPERELHRQRLVEAVDASHARDVVGGGLVAEQHRHRVARRERA